MEAAHMENVVLCIVILGVFLLGYAFVERFCRFLGRNFRKLPDPDKENYDLDEHRHSEEDEDSDIRNCIAPK